MSMIIGIVFAVTVVTMPVPTFKSGCECTLPLAFSHAMLVLALAGCIRTCLRVHVSVRVCVLGSFLQRAPIDFRLRTVTEAGQQWIFSVDDGHNRSAAFVCRPGAGKRARAHACASVRPHARAHTRIQRHELRMIGPAHAHAHAHGCLARAHLCSAHRLTRAPARTHASTHRRSSRRRAKHALEGCRSNCRRG